MPTTVEALPGAHPSTKIRACNTCRHPPDGPAGAFPVAHYATSEHGHHTEQSRHTPDSIRADVETFLLEYRLNAPEYWWQTRIEHGALVDPASGRHLTEIAAAGLEYAQAQLLASSSRPEADASLIEAIARRESELHAAQNELDALVISEKAGTTVVHLSPAGELVENAYGFLTITTRNPNDPSTVTKSTYRIETTDLAVVTELIAGLTNDQTVAAGLNASEIIRHHWQSGLSPEAIVAHLSKTGLLALDPAEMNKNDLIMFLLEPDIQLIATLLHSGRTSQAEALLTTVQKTAQELKKMTPAAVQNYFTQYQGATPPEHAPATTERAAATIVPDDHAAAVLHALHHRFSHVPLEQIAGSCGIAGGVLGTDGITTAGGRLIPSLFTKPETTTGPSSEAQLIRYLKDHAGMTVSTTCPRCKKATVISVRGVLSSKVHALCCSHCNNRATGCGALSIVFAIVKKVTARTYHRN